HTCALLPSMSMAFISRFHTTSSTNTGRNPFLTILTHFCSLISLQLLLFFERLGKSLLVLVLVQVWIAFKRLFVLSMPTFLADSFQLISRTIIFTKLTNWLSLRTSGAVLLGGIILRYNVFHDKTHFLVITPPVVSATRGHNNITSLLYHKAALQATSRLLFIRQTGGALCLFPLQLEVV